MNTTINFPVYLSEIHPRNGMRLGIVETPCFPCKYYAGWFWAGHPVSNFFIYFHDTIDKALDAVAIIAKHNGL